MFVRTEGNKIFVEGEVISTNPGKPNVEGRILGPEEITVKIRKDDVEYLRELLEPSFEGMEQKYKPSVLKRKSTTVKFKSSFPIRCWVGDSGYHALYYLCEEKGIIRGSRVVLCLEAIKNKCLFVRSLTFPWLNYHSLKNFFETEAIK